MINSLWSGISGLQVHQTSLNVIGNDVANVNTVGYKQSNITFQDAFYESLSSSGEGTSGKQVGLGVSVGKISKDFTSGTLKETGVDSNLAISGDGFFVLKDDAGQNATYTRAGDFEYSYDETSGTVQLMGPDGKYLYGTAGATGGDASTLISLPADAQSMQVSSNGVISYTDADGVLVEDYFTIDIASFPSESSLTQMGGSQYAESVGSGSPIYNSTDCDLRQNYLESSNVDLSREFTEMIVAERGFQANSRTVTTSDSMLQELMNLKR